MKFLPSPTARKFELELFKFCKLNEEAQTANAGVLLWELEKMGITREDARMKPIIEILRRLRRFFLLAFKFDTFFRASIVLEGREEVFGEDALATVELDFFQFCLAISHSSMLISRTFKGQLVIPEFEEFCRHNRQRHSVQC